MGLSAGVRRVEVRHRPRPRRRRTRGRRSARGEDPRDRARGTDRVGDGGGRRARCAEDGAASTAAIDGADAQPSVEARAPACDARVEVVERAPVAGRTGEQRGARERAHGRGGAGGSAGQRLADRPADAGGAADDTAQASGHLDLFSSAVDAPGACVFLRSIGPRRPPPCRQPRGDDRSGRGPDVGLDPSEVRIAGIFDPCEHPAHPGLHRRCRRRRARGHRAAGVPKAPWGRRVVGCCRPWCGALLDGRITDHRLPTRSRRGRRSAQALGRSCPDRDIPGQRTRGCHGTATKTPAAATTSSLRSGV